MKWLLRKAADKQAGQQSVCSQIHSHLSLLFCRELHFPSASAWLPDRFCQERQHGRLKLGRGKKPGYFPPPLFSGVSPPRFQLCPPRSPLRGTGSLAVSSVVPRDGPGLWVLLTLLSCTVLAALGVLVASLSVFDLSHHRMFGFPILL